MPVKPAPELALRPETDPPPLCLLALLGIGMLLGAGMPLTPSRSKRL